MLLLLIVARAPQALVLPSTGLFVQHGVVTLGADRYAYLPLLLLAAPALATALHSIATAEEAAHVEAPRRFPRGTYGELCLLVLGGLVLAYEGRATAEYGMVWKDSLSLWRHVVDVDPGDAVAHGDLANAILAADAAGGPRPGEQSEAALREALAAYDRGVELLPSVGGEGHAVGRGADIWSNRGLVLAALDRKPEAIRCYEHATSAAGGGFSNAATESAAYTNWAVALRGRGRDREVVRKLLVPTTRHTMAELRDAWGERRPARTRLQPRAAEVATPSHARCNPTHPRCNPASQARSSRRDAIAG